MSDQTKPKRLYQLDGLRFPMICLIVLSHFDFLIPCSFGHFYGLYLINPVLAVDFFFMLSGFGLYYSLQDADSLPVLRHNISFAISHIQKIYLPYMFSVIISIPFTIWDRAGRHSLSYAIVMTIVLLIISALLLQSL
ncbi:MAG: hypothetical protein J6N76_06625, partial [Lachnospiraceae bacterium]|nr:hypothetical protein [Lachnospiraceae bacterium]